MPLQLIADSDQLSDLAAIRDLGHEVLGAITEQLAQIKPTPLQPAELRKALKDAIPDNDLAANALLRQLISLYHLQWQRRLKPQEILDGLAHALKRAPADTGWDEPNRKEWQELQPQLLALLDIEQVRTVVKALNLGYEYANLLDAARIMTDIRPIFGENDSRIEGAVISQTLRIYYNSRDGDHSLSLAMDHDDLKHLLQSCQRALAKAKTAKKHMQHNGDVPTIVRGDEDNAV